MKMNETVAGLTITAKTEGVDQAKKQVDGLTQSTQQLGVVSETTSKGARSLEDNWKRATLRFDEAARAQANIARETKLAEAAVRDGIATQQQAADHLKLVAQRYGEVATASKQMVAGMSAAGDVGAVASNKMIAGMSSGGEQAAKGLGLARHELINLSRQAQDVGVSLASGQSPLTVLMQQGSQIADVFIASGKSVGSFFSQAIGWAGSFLASTAGIVTGIAAFGVAAVYAMSQFVTASKTVEQALEEQNRLLKEGKALIDARTSAEARAQLNLKGQTQFETQRNLLDVQLKLNKAMEDAANIAERRVTTPTGGGMPEMGFAPSGVQALKDPGYAEIKTAVDNLNAAIASGQPGLKEFNDELGKVGLAHPELGNTIEKLMATGQELENATLKAKAMSDALKGIATDAQLAAVGLGSIAQFQLNNRMAKEATEATERQAQAVLKMAQAYPGMSIEVAKQLSALQGQLGIAEAVGVAVQQEAQQRATISQLLLEGKSLTEATAIADAQRAIAIAQIASAHQSTMVSLQGQLAVAQEITGLGQINAQYYANINNLMQQGLNLAQATAQAEMQRSIALAQVNAQAEQQLQNLRNEGELIRASSEEEKSRIQARQEYNKLIEQGVDAEKAGAVAAQMQANARDRQLREEEKDSERAAAAADARHAAYLRAAEAAEREAVAMRDALDAAIDLERAINGFVPFALSAAFGVGSGGGSIGGQTWTDSSGRLSQFNPAGYTSSYEPIPLALYDSIYGRGGYDPVTKAPNAQGREFQFNKAVAREGLASAVGGLLSQGVLTEGALGAPPILDTDRMGILQRAIQLLPQEQQIGATRQLVGQLESAPPSLATSELIKQLNDKLDQLTQATNENTSATSAMTDVLSPFYSSDPRRTHLGFRAFREGGIMTQYGELPLRHYQAGGMATSPQVAVFGEGSTPEAYVPVPSGRIPVEIKQPANSNQRPVNVNIIVHGNADANTVGALKATAFQQAQAMRRVMR